MGNRPSTIVVIDDNPDFLFTMETFLTRNGFNVETIQHEHVKFTVWDICGGNSGTQGDEIRSIIWDHYIKNNDITIFVIDSKDRGCSS